MSSTFGAPQQFDPAPDDPNAPAHGSNGATTTEQLAAAIDPNDPRLVSARHSTTGWTPTHMPSRRRRPTASGRRS